MAKTPSAKPEGALLRSTLEIFTLCGFAVAQPVYELLSRGAEFLLAHQLEPGDLVVLVAAISLLPPAALTCLEWIECLVSGKRRFHPLWVALLVAAIALPVLRNLPTSGAFGVAIVLGSIFAWAVTRWAPVRLFLTLLSPTVLIFPALFLLRPPVSGLLLPPPVAVAGSPEIASVTPVVLVVLDELPVSSLMNPDRRIDAGRYPAFADLARHATWFRNATTVAEGTFYAVPAILTGRYPERSVIAHVREYPENLFTWLGASYPMNVFETLSKLCPKELRQTTELEETFGERMRSTFQDLYLVYLHWLLPAHLSAHLPPVTSTVRDFAEGGAFEPAAPGDAPPDLEARTGAVAEIFARFIDSVRPTKRPVLHFLHVNLPHLPWKYLPSGKEYGPMGARLRPHGLLGEQWVDDEWATIQGFQRHLLQVAYTDRLLSQLLDRLRRTGLFDRALVIVTADHGVSFRPGDSRRGVTATNAADILYVPLFIKQPFQTQGVISDRNVETIDILPTLADVLGVELPWRVDGQSVLARAPARREKAWVDATGREIIGRVVMSEHIDGLDATLHRMHAIFGFGADPEALFRIGRHRDLIGRELLALPRVSHTGVRVSLSDARSFENIDPASSYVPAQIVGLFEDGPASEGVRDLAVAVNGRIRAVTRTYADGKSETQFAAMVPENAFRKGLNAVEIFEILDDEAGLRLAAIESERAVRHVLELGSDGKVERISVSDGRAFAIVPDAVQGEVVCNGMSFKGWAARVEQARVADAVLLFSGNELIARVRTGEFRRDIGERFQKSDLVRSGFSFAVPYSVIDDPSSPDLRFFAVAGDIASQLPYRDTWTRQE